MKHHAYGPACKALRSDAGGLFFFFLGFRWAADRVDTGGPTCDDDAVSDAGRRSLPIHKGVCHAVMQDVFGFLRMFLWRGGVLVQLPHEGV